MLLLLGMYLRPLGPSCLLPLRSQGLRQCLRVLPAARAARTETRRLERQAGESDMSCSRVPSVNASNCALFVAISLGITDSGLVVAAAAGLVASATMAHWVSKSGIDPLDAMLPRMAEFVSQLHEIASVARAAEPSKGQSLMDEHHGRF